VLAATSVFKHSFALTVTKNNLSERNVGKRKTLGGKKKVLFTSWRLRISIDCEKSSKKEETAQYLDNGGPPPHAFRRLPSKEPYPGKVIRILDNNNSKGWIKVHVKIG
jgi:hypothetical protein